MNRKMVMFCFGFLFAVLSAASAADPPLVIFCSQKSPLREAPIDEIKRSIIGDASPGGIKVAWVLPPENGDDFKLFLKLTIDMGLSQFRTIWQVRKQGGGFILPKHSIDIEATKTMVRVYYPSVLGVARLPEAGLGDEFLILWTSSDEKKK